MSPKRPSLAAVLEKHQAGISDEDVASEFDHILSSSGAPGSSPLSAAEVTYLAEHGGPGVRESLAAWDPEAARVERARLATNSLIETVQSTWSVVQVAKILDVDRSRIFHRIADRTLWSVRVGSQRRIPRWQFLDDNGTLLPGLTQVVRAIPDGASRAVVDSFMRSPQPELDALDPVSYLAQGGAPGLVAEFLADLDRW